MTEIFQTYIDPTQQVAAIEARMRKGDLPGAMVDVRKLLTTGPDLRERWANVTWIAETIGDTEAALQAARRYFMIDTLNPVAALKVAELICETGRVEMALDVAQSIADQRPGDPAPQFHLGFYSARLGDFAQAVVHYRTALASRPDLTFVWQQLAALKTFTDPADPDLTAMTNLSVRLASASTEIRAPLLYALGKAYEDLGDVPRAFSSYSEGSRLMSAERPWDARGFEAAVDEIVRDFDRRLMSAQPPSGMNTDRPMFLIGAPRSGMALMERVLTGCDGVGGGDALNFFRLSTLPLGEHRPSRIDTYAEAAAKAGSPDFWTGFASNYLAFLDERFGFEGRIVDRSLNHTQIVGSIRLAFPKAPVAWVRRDPYDVAWSCFRTPFARGNDWKWTLQNTAVYLHQVDRLHAHWSALLSDDLKTFDYEALVRTPEPVIHALAGHMGVVAGPRAINFQDNPRPVDSASLRELRRPASQDRVGAWRPFEAQMAPFIKAYEGFKASQSGGS
ncbi:MAG TPA: sulfotransferase [Caulobacteraceae bacterium]|jgi:tetratricopeptide (TPR) repeat protein|nr:sulfotransferase [Caulobacteraceae bacterium]